MERELNDKEMGVLERVRKLMALASNNPNEAEATSAAQMAQKLLEAYNLDMAMAERTTGASKRSDSKLKGGLYKWQRSLWEEVAKLNFCMYWSEKGLVKGSTYQHRILGRHANVVSTKLMAEYLQETVEKLAREWAGDPRNWFTKAAVSYRDGMTYRVVEKLVKRREEILAEERRKKREEDAKRSHPGHTSSTALVLLDVIQSEEDANMDYLYGEGYSARQRMKRAQAEAEYAARLGARQKWIDENPEAYAEEQAAAHERQAKWLREEAKRAKRRKTSVTYRSPSYKGDLSAFHAGHRKGEDIGIDVQVSHNPAKGVK